LKTSLKPYNSFGIEAFANNFTEVVTEIALKKVLDQTEGNVFVLGGGSNILLIDDVQIPTIKVGLKGIEIVEDSPESVLVKAMAGENWHDFVLFCIKKNWGGIENLSLIPGSVGAAPMQNIGAYGVEIKNVFHSLEAIELSSGLLKTFYLDECLFGYRYSIFKDSLKDKCCITSVTFKLSKKPELHLEYGAIKETLERMQIKNPTIKDISDAVIAIRKSKLPDPAVLGNAGSFFKNPVVSNDLLEEIMSVYPSIPSYSVDADSSKIPAGWLIEQCGWKGKKIGNTGCHKDQALVIVNYGDATGREIWNFAQKVKQSVLNKFGVEISPEVNVIGL
jgi:UDP-N-acetylmuramate dehydrogenase